MKSTRNPHSVAFHGAYFTQNFGDRLLFHGFLSRALRCAPYQISAPFARHTHDVPFPVTSGGLADLDRAEKAVFFGGGYFGENHDPAAWTRKFRRNHLPLIDCIREKKIPYGIFGVGVGPISDPQLRSTVANFFQKAVCATVRDEESLEFLRKSGVTNPNISQTVDAAVALVREETLPAISRNLTRIGLNIALVANPRAILKDFVLFRFVRRLAYRCGCDQITIFSDMPRTCKGEQFAKWVVRYLRQTSRLNIRREIYSSPTHLVSFIAAQDLVITPKLHVGIVSLTIGRKTLAFPSHAKTRRFYKQVGRERFCMDRLDLDRAFELAMEDGLPLEDYFVKASDCNFRELEHFLRS